MDDPVAILNDAYQELQELQRFNYPGDGTIEAKLENLETHIVDAQHAIQES